MSDRPPLGTYNFDVTEKITNEIKKYISKLPGNPGQEVLVKDLAIDANFDIGVSVEANGTAVNGDFQFSLDSNHPEAIEQIMEYAEQLADLLAQQALIPNRDWKLADAVSSGNWKIIGIDSSNTYPKGVFRLIKGIRLS
ncbi:hypothetical protein UFOVP554_13 [uncultured Caudovirales phage]|uniref:Uncharacterized protein n=1 Tax=uncultured Caudovirales phage TaxID=2100421 RepID=A0A6J5MWF1_9CAUD|nr:hypothetical protein UFOVP554_13 [uncultured Caudovirales phage]